MGEDRAVLRLPLVQSKQAVVLEPRMRGFKVHLIILWVTDLSIATERVLSKRPCNMRQPR